MITPVGFDNTTLDVLMLLRTYKSMSFLELASLSQVDEGHLESIVHTLVDYEYVRVTNESDPVNKLITARDKAFEVSKS